MDVSFLLVLLYHLSQGIPGVYNNLLFLELFDSSYRFLPKFSWVTQNPIDWFSQILDYSLVLFYYEDLGFPMGKATFPNFDRGNPRRMNSKVFLCLETLQHCLPLLFPALPDRKRGKFSNSFLSMGWDLQPTNFPIPKLIFVQADIWDLALPYGSVLGAWRFQPGLVWPGEFMTHPVDLWQAELQRWITWISFLQSISLYVAFLLPPLPLPPAEFCEKHPRWRLRKRWSPMIVHGRGKSHGDHCGLNWNFELLTFKNPNCLLSNIRFRSWPPDNQANSIPFPHLLLIASTVSQLPLIIKATACPIKIRFDMEELGSLNSSPGPLPTTTGLMLNSPYHTPFPSHF